MSVQRLVVTVGLLIGSTFAGVGGASANQFIGDLVYCDLAGQRGVYEPELGDLPLDNVEVEIVCTNAEQESCSIATQTGMIDATVNADVFIEGCQLPGRSTFDISDPDQHAGRYLVNMLGLEECRPVFRLGQEAACSISVNPATLPFDCNSIVTPTVTSPLLPSDGNGDGDFCDAGLDGPFVEGQILGDNGVDQAYCESLPNGPLADGTHLASFSGDDDPDLTRCSLYNDFGYEPPAAPCELELDKTCCIPPPRVAPTTAFDCSDAKPIESLTLIWSGPSGVNLVSEGGQTISNIQNGQTITLNTTGLGNDVDVTLSGAVSGVSRFHVSCSDAEMNGADDCGRAQGNGKDNVATRINSWVFEGMGGASGSLSCTPASGELETTACVQPSQPSDFACSDSKPITTLTLIWDGPNGVNLVSEGGQSISNIQQGESVSIDTTGLGNDVDVTLSGAVSGVSRFHVSCSDSEMNGPEDCGKPAGDGKDNVSARINDWLFEGMSGNSGSPLACTPPDPGSLFQDVCEISIAPAPHCTTRVRALTLRYVGGDCSISNAQGGKATCTGPSLSGVSSVALMKDADKVTPTPNTGVGLGDTFTIRKNDGGDIPSDVVFAAATADGTQNISLHASCSQPLNLGDRFGAFEVFAMERKDLGPVSLGATVEYQYHVSNPNTSPVQVSSVFDDQLGELLAPDMLALAPGESRTLFASQTLMSDVVNTATVSGSAGGQQCVGASDSASFIVVPPPPPPPTPFVCSDAKPITTLTLIWTGASGVNLVSEGGQTINGIATGQEITLNTSGLGNDVDITLSGATSGVSRFHVSCSDSEMNGSEDCGKPQGDGKDNGATRINDWLFEGMGGATTSLDCTH